MLGRQRSIVATAWRLLARQHAADGLGHDDAPLRGLVHHPAEHVAARWQPPLTRTRTQRAAELRALATQLGWVADIGMTALDDVAGEFSRHARLGSVTPELPPEYRLFYGSLARPVSDLAVELGGLDTPVLAGLYLLPAAARTAVTAWRSSFSNRIGRQHVDLLDRAGRGETGAGEALLGHLARWSSVIGQASSGTPPPDQPVQLTLLERTRLRWPRDPDDPRLWLCWRFRVDDVAAPRLRGLVAADPGIRRLWTTLDSAGTMFFGNPMGTGTWRRPGSVALKGDLRRPWTPELAEVQRHAALVTRFLAPVQCAAGLYLLNHQQLALEEPDLAGFARLRAEYGPWAAWSGATIQHQYVADIARLSRTLVLIPARAAATNTCSSCHTRASMRYWGRAGRCRTCGARHDRDLNAAANLYRMGQERL